MRRIVSVFVMWTVPFFCFGWGAGLSSQIDDALDAFDDHFLEKIVIGYLDEGEEESWNLGLDRRDNYWIVGVCDYDCEDIDLCAEGECDSGSEDIALVYLDNVSSIEIEVDMYKCDEAYCYYAVLILRD